MVWEGLLLYCNADHSGRTHKHTHTHTHIHRHTNTIHTHTHTHMRECTHTHIHARAHTHHTKTHTHIRTHTPHTHRHTHHTQTHTHTTHTYTHTTHTHTHTHTTHTHTQYNSLLNLEFGKQTKVIAFADDLLIAVKAESITNLTLTNRNPKLCLYHDGKEKKIKKFQFI